MRKSGSGDKWKLSTPAVVTKVAYVCWFNVDWPETRSGNTRDREEDATAWHANREGNGRPTEKTEPASIVVFQNLDPDNDIEGAAEELDAGDVDDAVVEVLYELGAVRPRSGAGGSVLTSGISFWRNALSACTELPASAAVRGAATRAVPYA